MLQVLEGKDIDVLAPFPAQHLALAAQWMHCYKTLIFGDEAPATTEGIEEYLRVQAALPQVRTWGIIDKKNLTGSKVTDIPLAGIVFLELATPRNAYFHVASSRRAWGDKLAQPALVEQAGNLIIPQVFEDTPSLQRLSCATFANNKAARNLCRRLGFHKDGYFEAMGLAKGQPVDVVHFGLVRPQAALAQEA